MRIYYLYAGKELRIVRVLHGKRDIISLLEEETANEDD
jgi:plasmid stabilization system protein ParE